MKNPRYPLSRRFFFSPASCKMEEHFQRKALVHPVQLAAFIDSFSFQSTMPRLADSSDEEDPDPSMMGTSSTQTTDFDFCRGQDKLEDPDADTLRVMLSTDNHLGYEENDDVRGKSRPTLSTRLCEKEFPIFSCCRLILFDFWYSTILLQL